ncbi:hypothetical protein GC170_08170 [bacterium]|nr:hypothetical protein [bacterium]
MNRFRHPSAFVVILIIAAVTTVRAATATPLLSQDKPAETAEPEIVSNLRKVMESNCKANEAEKIEEALATIHPDSPNFAATRQLTEKLFEALDLKYELKSFGYIGSDETYAVGRAKVRASSADPLKFKNNESDLMIVFRKDKEDWKIWSQSILNIKFD